MTSAREIIAKSDFEIIKKIAKNYNMSIEDFGRLISKKADKPLRHHVRFSDEELKEVDKKAKALKLKRSKYCRLCYKKALEQELYKNINILDAAEKDGTTRKNRVSISFDSAEEYKKMRELADKFSIHFSSLIRYFALNIDL